MINNKKFNILIIDNNKNFNEELSNQIKEYKFNVTQIFDEVEVLESLEKSYDNIDLILLNIDFDDNTTTKIFQFIAKHTQSKVILLSEEDIGEKREEYFSQGILDYHLTNKKVKYIVDDIIDTIDSLYSNKKETILILDRSKEICTTLEKILITRNYNVIVANTAKSGLDIIKNNNISLLVLDMEINDINALDILEGLRDMYLLNQFYVLALSSNRNPSIVRDTLKSGAKDFLKKPFLYEEFILKIDILVKSARTKKTTFTQKKEIENNLKIFKELLNSTIGAMFIFENDICLNCNNEAIKILGYDTKKQILDKNIFEIFTEISENHKEELLDNTTDHYFEDTIISKDKNVYQVEIKERNILIENKRLKIIAIMDVTAVKHHQQILSQQTKMASMGEMIGNIAHQWRQPLSAISIAAGGIKLNYEFEMENRAETVAELDNIVENTKFLSSTIESFQNFLKIDKVTKRFDVPKTVQKSLSIINSNLKSNDILLVESYEDNCSVEGIENELIQVLLNLINNSADALKHHVNKEERFIFLKVYRSETEVLISFQDNGLGIPNNIISKIFEPYFTTKHKSQGTGLGLYMTHQIVERMDGKISVKNKEFEYKNKKYYGAKFLLSFPFIR